MTYISLSNTEVLAVPFKAYKIHKTALIWINPDLHITKEKVESKSQNELLFLDRFSYAVKNTRTFKSVRFNVEDFKIFHADRYGGAGIGENGGSARAGTIEEFQIKGIGRTPLIGDEYDGWHKDGAMGLFEAVIEVINTEVYHHILPIGTGRSHGIIYVGDDTYVRDDFGEKTGFVMGPGVLCVREACLRPAHFIRAGFFKPLKEYATKVSDDVDRVSKANVKLLSNLNGERNVIKFIGKFLSNCANQFAFARLFRIMHGVLSPSNIAFDGRWIDVGCVGFIHSGLNYALDADKISFLDESKFPLKIIEEFVYTFCKYTHIDLNWEPLVKYYNGQLSAYTAHYIPRLFGLSSGELKISGTLLRFITSKIVANSSVTIALPIEFTPEDPIYVVLKSAFMQMKNGTPQSSSAFPIQDIRSMFAEAHFLFGKTIPLESFIIAAAIRSLKPVLFAPFFYSGAIVPRVEKKINDVGMSYWKKFIDKHISVAKFIFDDNQISNPWIFNSDVVQIVYDQDRNQFKITYNNNETTCDIIELHSIVCRLDNNHFTIEDMDFKPLLLLLIEDLRDISDQQMKTRVLEDV